MSLVARLLWPSVRVGCRLVARLLCLSVGVGFFFVARGL
jgi:hypothetical protein